MKNKKEELLDYLASENTAWVSSAKCADFIGVSTRQTRKYINQINAEWKNPVILSSNKGYKIDPTEYGKYLSAQKNETPEMRIYHIVQKMITSREIDIFDLSEELYVSIPTIENDLKVVRKLLKKHSLSFKRNKTLLSIEGGEKEKRELISWLISNNSSDSFVFKDELKLLTYHYEIFGFRSTIRDIFAANDIFVNDYTFNNIILHLIITIDRISNHRELEDPINLDKIKESCQFKVVLQIQTYIENTFQIKISNIELYNIALVIFNNTSMINYSAINPNNIGQFIEEKYINIAKKVINDIENTYYLEKFDDDFLVKFTIHIKNLFERAQNNYSATNPLAKKIKNSYPFIYDIAVYIAQSFSTDYNISLTEDEIAFLAFHIGSYFEVNTQNKYKAVCAFVYADYYSFHKNAVDTLMKKFGDKITIKYATSINNYKDLDDVDLIISTVNLPYSKNCINVNPFLKETDFKNIQILVEDIISKKKNKTIKAYLSNFFDEDLFYKDIEFSDKDQVLEKQCGDLYRLGYTESIFYHDIKEREAMSSTAFGNVAIPHVLTKSAKKSFISIVISKKPIKWDVHEVYIVAMIGIHEDSRKIFSELFETLIDILSNPSNIKKLTNSDNFKDFISQVRYFIDLGCEV